MPGSRRTSWARALAALAALALGASGCWLQRATSPTRNAYVAGDVPITPANVGQLVELWRSPSVGQPLNEPIALGDDVWVTGTNTVSRLSASSGAVRYTRTIVDPDTNAPVTALSSPVHHDGEIDVGWLALRTSPTGGASGGGLVRLVPATGDLVAPIGPFGYAVRDIAEEDGELVTANAAAAIGSLSIAEDYVAWRGINATNGVTIPNAPGTTPFAVTGDHLVRGLGGTALGWNGTSCTSPTTLFDGRPACFPDWQATLGDRVSPPVALGVDAAVYGVDTDQVAVVDAATGAVRFTGTIPDVTSTQPLFNPPLVAGSTILVSTDHGRVVAFPAGGCGQADCAPLWESRPGGSISSATVIGEVVYVIAGDISNHQLVALALGGCGAATCAPLARYSLGTTTGQTARPIYDAGRILVATNTGQVVAFGLPPS